MDKRMEWCFEQASRRFRLGIPSGEYRGYVKCVRSFEMLLALSLEDFNQIERRRADYMLQRFPGTEPENAFISFGWAYALYFVLHIDYPNKDLIDDDDEQYKRYSDELMKHRNLFEVLADVRFKNLLEITHILKNVKKERRIEFLSFCTACGISDDLRLN